MRRARSAIPFLIAVFGAATAEPVAAQQVATPSPFHVGQWGLEASAAGSSGGVLRFITPRTAIVFDVSGARSSSEASAGSIVTPGGLVKRESYLLDVSLGLRRHIMIAPRIAAVYGIGALAGTSQQRIEYAGQDASSFYQTRFGGFVDGGGQLMVTDHFAVGLTYRLQLQHSIENTNEGSGNFINASFIPIRATLYF